jgi:ammonia channel protein AmtB
MIRTDIALDLFAKHAVGGIGLLANGLFGTKDVADLDGVSRIEGGA